MKKIKELSFYILIILLVVLIRYFVISPVSVDGNSMYPNLKDGELLLLNKLDNKYERFEIVVFKNGSTKLIKRVIGLPGEHVAYKDNELYINHEKIKEQEKLLVKTADFSLEDLGFSTIPENMYLVLGDNRTISMDSRTIGLISKDDISGTVNFRLFPLNRFGKISE